MKISLVAALAILGLVFAFAAGWYSNEVQNAHQLARLTDERDTALKMTHASLDMSQKAVSHALSSAETLEICLTKIGFPRDEGRRYPPTPTNSYYRPGPWLAGLQEKQ